MGWNIVVVVMGGDDGDDDHGGNACIFIHHNPTHMVPLQTTQSPDDNDVGDEIVGILGSIVLIVVRRFKIWCRLAQHMFPIHVIVW